MTDRHEMEVIQQAIRNMHERHGMEFGPRHYEMVRSRIWSRMIRLGISDWRVYGRKLSDLGSGEEEILLGLLTTHHTSFFREMVHFRFLAEEYLPYILPKLEQEGRPKIRIWSAACSRGQEVYSLAAFMHWHLSRVGSTVDFEILGSDIDPESVRYAENGVYPVREVLESPRQYVDGYWNRGTGGLEQFMRISRAIRSRCRFASYNLLKLGLARPSETFDIIFCRNVFIYFSQDQISRSVEQLSRLLTPNGILITGISEPLIDTGMHKVGNTVYARRALAGISGHDDSSANTANVAGAAIRKIPAAAVAPASRAAPPTPTAPAGQVAQVRTEFRKARVLIVDDSRTYCAILRKMMESDSGIEVVGVAERPSEVEKLVVEKRPDVMLLDINLPEMSGVELLKKLYPKYHLPAIMVSTVKASESSVVVEALDNGAVDYFEKPAMASMSAIRDRLIASVKACCQIDFRKARREGQNAAGRRSVVGVQATDNRAAELIVIGSSTGGTEALKKIFCDLPADIPPILVAQHIPAVFSRAFADRLNALVPYRIKEAEHGEPVRAGHILIAPGGQQMTVSGSWPDIKICITPGDPKESYNPSVNNLFHSVCRLEVKRLIGILLTGMGRDGADGLKKMRAQGALTIAQDESTSVVYGMPRAAAEIGAATQVLPLGDIAGAIMTPAWRDIRKSA